MKKQIERRGLAVAELRRANPEARTIEGYAALFNVLSEDLGGLREMILPGAFSDALGAGQDVRALFNHDRNLVLGRSSAGTLRMVEDERGLKIEVDAPDTQMARDLMTSIDRGDITQMSFGFMMDWSRRDDQSFDVSTKPTTRTIKRVAQLLDVSIVTEPAYPQTTASLRSLTEAAIEAGLIVAPAPSRLPALQLRQRLARLHG